MCSEPAATNVAQVNTAVDVRFCRSSHQICPSRPRSRPDGGRIAQVIQPPARMRLDIAQRLFLAREVVEHPGQHRVLVDIRRVPRMVMMLIAEHAGS